MYNVWPLYIQTIITMGHFNPDFFFFFFETQQTLLHVPFLREETLGTCPELNCDCWKKQNFCKLWNIPKHYGFVSECVSVAIVNLFTLTYLADILIQCNLQMNQNPESKPRMYSYRRYYIKCCLLKCKQRVVFKVQWCTWNQF